MWQCCEQRLTAHRGVNKVPGPEKVRASAYHRELGGGSSCMSCMYEAISIREKHQRLYSRQVYYPCVAKQIIDSKREIRYPEYMKP